VYQPSSALAAQVVRPAVGLRVLPRKRTATQSLAEQARVVLACREDP
jgi:hypothetical protein